MAKADAVWKSNRADAAMPDFIEPALAHLVERPPSGAGWVHEVKFDGYRMQMRIQGGNDQLPQAFARKLDGSIHYGAALVSLDISRPRSGGAGLSPTSSKPRSELPSIVRNCGGEWGMGAGDGAGVLAE